MSIRVPGFTPVPVHARDGSVWDVGVEWLPRTPGLARRYRRRVRDGGLDPFGAVGDGGSGSGRGRGWTLDLQDLALLVVAAVVLLAVVLLAVFVVVPLLLVVVDVVVLVVAALGAVATRVLLRRPWRVVARCTRGPSAGEEQVRAVVGVRAARAARDELRAAIAAAGDGRARTVVPR